MDISIKLIIFNRLIIAYIYAYNNFVYKNTSHNFERELTYTKEIL